MQQRKRVISQVSVILALIAFVVSILVAAIQVLMSKLGVGELNVSIDLMLIKSLIIFYAIYLVFGRIIAAVAVKIVGEVVLDRKLRNYALAQKIAFREPEEET